MTHKKLSTRILSLVLTAAMVGTMMPSTVFAAEGDVPLGASGIEKTTSTITAFDELGKDYTKSVPFDGHTYALTVELGTPIEEIVLPTELGVTVEKTTTTTTPPAKDEAQDDVVDSGEAPKDTAPADEPTAEPEDKTVAETPAGDESEKSEPAEEVQEPADEPAAQVADTDTTLSGNEPATPSDAEPAPEPEETPDADAPPVDELEQDEPEQDKETTVTEVAQETIPVTWKGDREYTPDQDSKVIYTAVPPEGFALADGVALPTIYVMVGKQARAANITTWTELQTALTAGGDIKLTADITAGSSDVFLNVPTNITVTLDLNGFTIDRGLKDATAILNGHVITIDGNLTVKDTSTEGTGVITGAKNSGIGSSSGSSNIAGGIYVPLGGVFTLESGKISGNIARGNGGGVYNSGTFTMKGGEISANTGGNYGGGVSNGGTFTMEGGEISANTASSGGGGVMNNRTFSVGGTAVINNNKSGNTGAEKANNLALYDTPIQQSTATPLATGASIGVTWMSGKGVFTNENAAWETHADKFFSDNTAYKVRYNVDTKKLELVESPSITFDARNGATIADAEIGTDGTITLPSNPTWGEYTFAGWYTGIDGTGTAFANSGLSDSTTVYAKWTKGGKTVRTTPLDLTGSVTPAPDQGWTWEAGTSTLTLDGVTIESGDPFAIKLPAGATITAAGTNTINLQYTSTANNEQTAAIDCAGALAFKGSGTINIDYQHTVGGTFALEACGVLATDDITIDALTLKIDMSRLNPDRYSNQTSLAGVKVGSGKSVTISSTSAADVGITIGTAYTGCAIVGNIAMHGGTLSAKTDNFELISGSAAFNGGVSTLQANSTCFYIGGNTVSAATGAKILGSKAQKDGSDATAITIDDVNNASNQYKYLSFSFGPSITVGTQTGSATYGTATSPAFAVTSTSFSTPTFAPSVAWTSGSAPAGVTTAFTESNAKLTMNTTAATPAGEYKFKVVSAKADSGNYESAEATLKVDKLTATITWGSTTSFPYNGSVQAPTATVSNKVGSDAVTVTVTGGQTNVGTSYTATADALAGVAAGNYAMPSSKPTQTFAITAKTVTVTDGTLEVKKAYDGNTTAGTATGALALTGVVSGDAVNVSVKVDTVGTYADANVGKNKTVTLTISLDGTAKGNYALGSASYSFTKAEITKVAYTGTAANAPDSTPQNKGDTSITIKPVTPPTDENVEYAVSKTNTPPTSDSDWQTSTTFDNLDPNTEYFFFARVKENDNHAPGGVSSPGTPITTDKSEYTTKPTKPDGTPNSKSDTSITLKTVTPPDGETLEYGIEKPDGTIDWQDGPTFSPLSPNTEYKFYTRVKENDKHKAGPKSDATPIKTAKAPYTGTEADAATLSNKTDTSVTLAPQTITGETVEYGYSTTAGGTITWQDGNTFTGLAANTDYYFFARVKENDTHAAGATSASTTFKTDKVAYTGTQSTEPGAPKSKTHNTVTLNTQTIDGETVEYGIKQPDGTIAWQDSPIFSGLNPNTEYTFYTRVKENDTHKAGATSASTAITTNPAPTTVSGNVKDSDDSNLDNVLVELKQGGTVIKSATTTNDGNYILNDVPAGVYKLVVTKGTAPNTVVTTQMITVAGTPITNQNVKFDSGNKNTVVESKPGAPDVAVGGMNDLLNTSNIGTTLTAPEKTAVDAGGSVELKFTADVKAASDVTADKGKIEAISTGKKIDLLLDLSVLKTVKDGVGTIITNGTKITTLANLIEVYLPIPAELQGKAGLALYRVHNGTAQVLGTSPDGNGEYYTIDPNGEFMTLYVKNFSTYALGYDAFTVTLSGGGSGATGAGTYANGDPVNLYAGTKSNYSFDGWTTTSAGVVFADASSDTTSFTMPSNNVIVTANWKSNGGGGGSSGNGGGSSSDSSEYDFWMSAKSKIEKAEQGDVIKINAKSYDKVPASFMDALRKNSGVGLVITWNGKTITIPAGKAPKNEPGRIYWPLSKLAELYADITEDTVLKQAPQNPETGGPGKLIPVTGGGELITLDAPTPVVENAIPGITENAQAIAPVQPKAITPPDAGFEADAYVGTPDARAARGINTIAVAASVILLAAIGGYGVLVWKRRKEEQE